MKKMLCMLLMLLLSMLVCFPSYANEPETLNLTQVHAYETATSLCFIEDTLYMLGAYGLYEYKENELTTVVDLSDAYAYRYQKERPEEEEQALVWEKAISARIVSKKPEPKHFQIQYCSIFLCIARNANERQKVSLLNMKLYQNTR